MFEGVWEQGEWNGKARDRIEDRRWIRQNLLTFRWYLDSSVGFGACEVVRLAHHAILDLIAGGMAFFVQMVGQKGRYEGKKRNLGVESVNF